MKNINTHDQNFLIETRETVGFFQVDVWFDLPVVILQLLSPQAWVNNSVSRKFPFISKTKLIFEIKRKNRATETIFLFPLELLKRD